KNSGECKLIIKSKDGFAYEQKINFVISTIEPQNIKANDMTANVGEEVFLVYEVEPLYAKYTLDIFCENKNVVVASDNKLKVLKVVFTK
ncbi:MAG: hypothetical protein IKC88_01685, partial [Opitutales bacterium]|nr:hypothetical protein [Opitutales bacterium]